MIYYTDIKIPQLRKTFLIAKNEKGVCSLIFNNHENNFVTSLKKYFNDEVKKNPKKLNKEVKQILEYFTGKRKSFAVEIFLKGTKFQTSVWKALLNIKYGETKTYSEIAEMTGKPKAVRAVGNICGQNPIPIFIPCHRVIRKDNSFGGFSGPLELKKKMLRLESKA